MNATEAKAVVEALRQEAGPGVQFEAVRQSYNLKVVAQLNGKWAGVLITPSYLLHSAAEVARCYWPPLREALTSEA